jgi:hypothetical protein
VGWELSFAPRCERDLAEIVRYMAQDNPVAAIRFGNTLIAYNCEPACAVAHNRFRRGARTRRAGSALPGTPINFSNQVVGFFHGLRSHGYATHKQNHEITYQ